MRHARVRAPLRANEKLGRACRIGGLFFSEVTRAAKLRGRTSKFPLEYAVEGCFRGIADRGCNLADVRTGRLEHFRSQFEPPPREICHGRLAQKVTKALRESRARNADLVGELGDGPGVRRVLMQQRERFTDHGIACSGEPSLLPIRQVVDETPQRLDEQNFRQPGKNHVAAGPWPSGFPHGELYRICEPLACGIIRDIDHEHGGQGRKYNLA